MLNQTLRTAKSMHLCCPIDYKWFDGIEIVMWLLSILKYDRLQLLQKMIPVVNALVSEGLPILIYRYIG